MRPSCGISSIAWQGTLPESRTRSIILLHVVGFLGGFLGVQRSGAEPLDHPHPTNGLDHRGEIGLLRLHGEHGRVDRRPRKPPAGDVHERQGRQGHDREQRIGDQQDDGDGHDHRRVGGPSRIITTKAWIWLRSLDDRLISCPVCARSW